MTPFEMIGMKIYEKALADRKGFSDIMEDLPVELRAEIYRDIGKAALDVTVLAGGFGTTFDIDLKPNK